jgi:hypothetical protein
VEWGKGTGDDVWFLHKLEELAEKMGCAPAKSERQSMVCCLEVMCLIIANETDDCFLSSCN